MHSYSIQNALLMHSVLRRTTVLNSRVYEILSTKSLSCAEPVMHISNYTIVNFHAHIIELRNSKDPKVLSEDEIEIIPNLTFAQHATE